MVGKGWRTRSLRVSLNNAVASFKFVIIAPPIFTTTTSKKVGEFAWDISFMVLIWWVYTP